MTFQKEAHAEAERHNRAWLVGGVRTTVAEADVVVV